MRAPADGMERRGFVRDFSDAFDASQLDRTRWLPYFLPHWSTVEAAAARYQLGHGRLELRIEEDQPAWRPGQDRASNLQTGHYAGPLGSSVGQFAVDPAFQVMTDLPRFDGYVPHFGYFETRVRATPVVGCHTALWMIGFDAPAAGEIQVFEIHGRHISGERSRIDHAVLPWTDPALVEERHRDWLPIDASEFHVYGVDWAPDHIDFYVDGERTCTIGQSPQYPMQFLLGVYERPSEVADRAHPATYPIVAEVDYFRGYRRAGQGPR